MEKREESTNIYSETWDRYVTSTFPKIQSRGPISRGDLEEWRVLNTSGSEFVWPGDEWGDKELTQHVFNTALADQLRSAPEVLCEIGSGAGRYTVLALERFPQAKILSFDVSREFEGALRERCAEAIREKRLQTFLLDGDPHTMLEKIEGVGLRSHIDAVYSFDAMVHVDLQTLIIYFVVAARVLKEGGLLAMNVADACSEKGFMKLLFEAPSGFRRCGRAGGHFMWVSRGIIRYVLPRLGFEVSFPEGNGRDLSFAARLVDSSCCARWLERAGASW